jgi:hypothetical protein
MQKLIDLLRRMYFRTLPGRIALFALVLLFAIPFAHLSGGAPPASDLRIVEGAVVDIQTRQGLKGSTDVELKVSGSSGSEELRYFANPGDNVPALLITLKGRVVRAWVRSTYENRIYQLDAEGQRIIDYEVRNRQLSGDPQNVLIYFVAVLGVFVLLSAKRYSEETV